MNIASASCPAACLECHGRRPTFSHVPPLGSMLHTSDTIRSKTIVFTASALVLVSTMHRVCRNSIVLPEKKGFVSQFSNKSRDWHARAVRTRADHPSRTRLFKPLEPYS
jgi:hypothetical protein